MSVYIVIVGIMIWWQIVLIIAEKPSYNKTLVTNSSMQFQAPLYWPLAIVIFLVAALRDGIGYDFHAYENLYNLLHQGTVSVIKAANRYNYEVGYVWLNRIMPNFQTLIFVVAILGVGIKLWYIYRWSDCRILTLIMYFTGIFLTFDMGVIRQGIAISLFLCVVDCCKQDKKIAALILIVISCFFHISSLIYIPVVFIGKKRFSRKMIYISIAIVSVVFFFDISGIIMKLLSMTGISVLTSKVEYYSTFFTGNINGSYIKRIIFLVLFTEFFQRKGFENDLDVLTFNSYYLSVFFMALFSSIDILGGRGVTAYYFMQSFLLATMYKKVNGKFWRVIIACLCIVLSLYAMKNTIVYGNVSGQIYSPYAWILGH